MTHPTRRSLLLGSVAVAATLGEGGWGARTASAANLTRFDASSTQGKAMLTIYAGAVGKMMDFDGSKPGDPLSWLFQWYTHGVKQPPPAISSSFKAPEIHRIYPNAADPNRALAETMWDTCTHYGQPEMYFLPWHRMYVFFFEQIIRSISGEANFTLPYWDYTDPQKHALPPEFTMPNHPVFKTLFRARRRDSVNNGGPIDDNRRNTFLNLNDMKLPTYLPTSIGGFCRNLDGSLHGNVHTFTGNRTDPNDPGMSFVPTAANDPVFWLHHCNIDRIWASWNKAGGANPDDTTFKQQSFTFADTNGKAVQKTVDSVLDTQQLNYVYSTYLDRPPGSLPFPRRNQRVAAFALHADTAAGSGPVTLSAAPATATLTPRNIPELSRSKGVSDLSVQLSDAIEVRELFLVLKDVEVQQDPGVVYDIYLNVVQGSQPNPDDPGYVGTLNFFSIHGEHAGHDGGPTLAFSATDALRNLKNQGRNALQPTVTLVPQGDFNSAAEPKIGNISLVSQG